MKKSLFTIVFLIAMITLRGQVFDHRHMNIDNLPQQYIDSVKANCRLQWAAASHGHQVLHGLKFLEQDDPTLDVTIGDGESGTSSIGGFLPDPNGTFCVMDGLTMNFSQCAQCCLGIEPVGYWLGTDAHESVDKTLAQCFPTINISGWCWCDELNTWTEAQTQDYLDQMQAYEAMYPNVKFIYCTGTAGDNGPEGYNRWLRNNQIRQFCIDNNKLLYDFADIECWSNGEFSYYIYNNDTVPVRHPDYPDEGWSHTNALNCKHKASVMWYMMAVLQGWNPQTFNHTVWQQQAGQSGTNLEADYNTDGNVDNRDKNMFSGN